MTDSQTFSQPGPDTDFGFTRVPAADKKPLVRAVFDSVAPKYDVMNDIMSLGIHRIWKRIFATRMRPAPNKTLLDLASGTGDIATAWVRNGGGPVFLTDINAAMLSAGRDRAIGRGIVAPFAYTVADAEALPFPSGCVDTVSIAFGLRNCTDKLAVLREARRVLKPGGRFFCLEFSRLQVAVMEPVYDRWSFDVLPRVGKLVAKDSESYRYLAESIRCFRIRKRWPKCCPMQGWTACDLKISQAALPQSTRGGASKMTRRQPRQRAPNRQKFFGSFFQKRTSSL